MKAKLALLTVLLMASGHVLAQDADVDADLDRDRGLDVDVDVALGDRYGDHFLMRRETGQIRSDELIGSNVLDAAGENVATINELLIDDDGRIAGLLLNVGGLLGIGATTVALSWDAVEVRRVGDEGVFEDAYEVRTQMTREQLEDAPEFQDEADDGLF